MRSLEHDKHLSTSFWTLMLTDDVFWHSTDQDFREFRKMPKADSGFHIGSIDQAVSRCGKRVMAIQCRAKNLTRLRDHGSWSRERIARLRRRGWDGARYLNRHEAIPLSRLTRLSESGDIDRIDQISDTAFRRLIPEAQDSIVVADPTYLKILATYPRRFVLDRLAESALSA